ncbi:MAG: catalase family protein [Singulisphaera sp.]
MSDMQEWLGLGEERPTTGEEGLIARVLAISLALLDTTARPVRRGQHPKHHGCVRAEFIVQHDLPEELRHGVLREGRTFPALIRFSNGRNWDDRKGDVHGMAIKLVGVAGEESPEAEKAEQTQDFVTADHPVFFIRDLADYVPFSEALFEARRSRWSRIGFVLRVLVSPHPPWKGLRAALAKKPDSPLRIQYWSQTPYRLGRLAVRYSCRPDLSFVPPPPPSRSQDKLREALSSHLASREARFDFLIQVQTDPVAMPVEDPTVGWDEAASPYRKVATIRIPPQVFDIPEQRAYCENLSFTPWHALPEHRPLGAINRARKVIYEALSARRHELNRVPRHEPTPADLPRGLATGGIDARRS